MAIIMLELAALTTQENCYCRNGTGYCNTRGCSRGNNPTCNDTDLTHFFLGYGVAGYSVYFGCNCPGFSYAGGDNGYHSFDPPKSYRYTNCTGFGLGDHDATDCCNFCCGINATTTM